MGRTPHLRGERSDQSAFLFHSPQTSSSRPKRPGPQRAHLLAGVVATDSFIVCCAVERPPYFAFAFACSCRCLCFWVPQGFSGCWKCRVLLKDTASAVEVRLLLLRPLFQHSLQPWVSLKTYRAAASTLPKTGSPTSGSLLVWV
jgi:hypothetical protein